MNRVPKVDIHTHILPPNLPRFAERFGGGNYIWLQTDGCKGKLLGADGKVFREVTDNLWDPKVRLEDCNRTGVDIQVLSTVPVMFSYWANPTEGLAVAEFLNDHIAEVVSKNPINFRGLGTLPMQSPKLAVRELERCLEMGLKGVQIGTNINGKNLSEPEFFEVFEAAADLGAAVFVHPWDMMGQERMSKYWLPWLVGMPAEISLAICSLIFSGVFERLPKLRIAFAHGGGSFTGTLGRVSHGFHARPDLTAIDGAKDPRTYLGRFFVDSLVHDPKVLDLTLQTYGEHRVCLGSDYPFPLGEDVPGQMIEASINDAALKNRLLGGNALEWLG